jgi:uncharacterized protein YbbK (DUF523 family)
MTQISAVTPCNFHPTRFYDPRSATHRTAVAVSACLVGEKVRYDGTDKLLPVHALLRKELNLIAVCPEVGAGLGVPRPPVQLIEIDGQIRARGRENRRLDVTAALQNFAAHSLQYLLNDHQLCGYLWKSRSPSCGFSSTPLFTADGIEVSRTSGIQADYFQRHLPYLNYCEETALATADAATDFVLRCRLAFDLLYTPNTPLAALHRHYAFLYENFDKSTAENLNALSATNHKTRYLAAFLEGCNQMPENALMKLFN